MGESVVPEAAS